ncbi:MAG: YigZ family protein [Bacteroidales bacterium]|nr:YigZ family protein [Bacteroidales bacterium]MDT8431703.1 YigZ family protein [Bacteroidales bacterium]
MISSYRTIATTSDGLFKDRGSKFLSFAFPVKSDEEVKEILQQLRKEYHDARHHCYAWKLGVDPAAFRANDDGEPSSSAGKPILNQIEKRGLTDTLVVVVRYFGGTLLGVGGLINAYRTAAEAALKNNRVVRKKIQCSYHLEFGYPDMNTVMGLVKEMELDMVYQAFGLNCSMTVRVDIERETLLLSRLQLIETCRYSKAADDL